MAVIVRGDATWEYSVQVSVQVQISPPQVTLYWPQDTRGIPDNYTVSRKAPGEMSWGPGVVLSGGSTSFSDTTVAAGTSYEYQVAKTNSSLAYSGYGYVQAVLEFPFVDNRGKIILIVDNSFASDLASELRQLQDDLVGDGWQVIRHDAPRNDSPSAVKSLIQRDYNADPQNVRAVFLFGHIPVAYSGEISPDKHIPAHVGAWPSDVYYGEMDGAWTDFIVNSTVAESQRNWNTPGDGKFDQSTPPLPVKLQLGRVDLWNLPAFGITELELLRRYLNKDHNYRHKNSTLPLRGLVHDSLGIRDGEAWAATSWRNFAPLLGPANVVTVPVGQWFPTLASEGYLWAYGCGAGSYTTISGLGNWGQYNDGNTWDFAANDTRATFYMLCGSWHGDWDTPNDILRAPLATTTYGLASFWGGLPHWYVHPMGAGETLGYCARLTQNNTQWGLYRNQTNQGAGLVHIALMGDPTLRMYPVRPPATFTGTMTTSGTSMSWTPSSDAVQGYHVYRAAASAGPFSRLTSTPVAGTTYTDTTVNSGSYTYMVRAIKLEITPSGSFWNGSQGVFARITDVVLGLPSVSVTAIDSGASESGPDNGVFRITRNDALNSDLVVYFTLSGTAENGADYAWLDGTVTIPAGADSTDVTVVPIDDSTVEGTETVVLTLSADPDNSYAVRSPESAAVFLNDNDSQPISSVWVDDAIPNGAWTGAGGGDAWQWISSNPAPFSGARAHQSVIASGIHYHYFTGASATLTLNSGDNLMTYVFLDPAAPPRELMLQWFDGSSWSHAAYWGDNLVPWGANGSASQRPMGPLPPAGAWMKLEVPASLVGLDGSTISGMNFILYDGRAAWDLTGKTSASAPPPDTTPPTVAITSPANGATVSGASVAVAANASDDTAVAGVQFKLDGVNLGAEANAPPYTVNWNTTTTANGSHTLTAVARDQANNQTTSAAVTVTVSNSTGGFSVIWMDDSPPAGAWTGTFGGDQWTWVNSNPPPQSGNAAHQSASASGIHCHWFSDASATLPVDAGDILFAYVFLDPASLPREVMLQWYDGASWAHAAYWGENLIPWGNDGTASQRPMGALPPSGQWVRLDVPASLVDLEGRVLSGMNFVLYDGRATWDATGK